MNPTIINNARLMTETAEKLAVLARNAGNENIGLSEEMKMKLVRYFCTNSSVGIWVDTFDQNLLEDILSYSDADFDVHYGQVDLTQKERDWLRARISGHIPLCQRCQVKATFDHEAEGVTQAT
jgi:hypothetical protein